MAEQYKIHPMIAQQDEIERRGMMVFDDIRRMPLYDEPYTSPMTTIILTRQGWLRTECDMRPTVFQEHTITVITPHRILCVRESSEDFQSTVIMLSATFLERLRHLYSDTYRSIMHFRNQPDLQLSDRQFEVIIHIVSVLSDISMQNIPSQSDMQGDLLKILFQMLQEYRISNESKEESLVPREELFSRFYKAIEEHFRESHEVQYYADLFGLTPKHFAAIIKKQTGIKALTWINNYVMIQSKSMLRHMQQMPIQQVALQMGFTELSAFSRFFKTNEGVTPSEYREKIK